MSNTAEIRNFRERVGMMHAEAVSMDAPRPVLNLLSGAIEKCGEWIRQSGCKHERTIETHPPGLNLTVCRDCGTILASETI